MSEGSHDVSETVPKEYYSEARKHFEAIVADAEEGVAIIDPDGKVGYVNSAAALLLGQHPTSVLQSLGIPLRASDQPTLVNIVARDDTLRLIELRIESLSGCPDDTLVLRLKDITKYQQTVSQAQKEIRRRDEFLAMLSHELRNPLAAIRNAAGLLTLENGGADIRRSAAAVLDRQFGHLTRILDDLLDVTRILRGRLEIDARQVVINQIVNDAIEAVMPALTTKQHRLRLNLSSDPLTVCGDPTRLEQVVINLLENAIKFTPNGGDITISLSCAQEDIELAISDNGPGISEELWPHVFEAFVQGKQTLDRCEGGLGIGLMLVQTFVKLHGGSINLEPNANGTGITSRLRLPLAQEDGNTSHADVCSEGSKPLNILLVEDNEDTRIMFAMLLESQGHHVISAATGHEGLDLAAQRPVDLAFVDIGLPGMNGYELAQRMRQNLTSVPHLVALTGYGSPEDVQRSMQAGFREHMVKPVRFAEVCRVLGTVQQRRQVQP